MQGTTAAIVPIAPGGPYHQLRVLAEKLGVAAAYGGKLHTTSTAGATATMTFSGRLLAVIAPLGPAYGSIRICLDPAASALPVAPPRRFKATTAVERDIVYVSGSLAPGSHVIQVTDPSGPGCSASPSARPSRRPCPSRASRCPP